MLAAMKMVITLSDGQTEEHADANQFQVLHDGSLLINIFKPSKIAGAADETRMIKLYRRDLWASAEPKELPTSHEIDTGTVVVGSPKAALQAPTRRERRIN